MPAIQTKGWCCLLWFVLRVEVTSAGSNDARTIPRESVWPSNSSTAFEAGVIEASEANEKNVRFFIAPAQLLAISYGPQFCHNDAKLKTGKFVFCVDDAAAGRPDRESEPS